MSVGIHNPFAPRVKPKKKIDRLNLEDDTEAHIGVKPPTVSLDGINYVITFSGTDDISTLGEKLIALVYDVAKKHTYQLAKHGVYVGPRLVNDDERALTYKGQQITVYAPEDTTREESIYRRIAYALLGLPIKDILAKHQVKIMERSVS